MDNNTQTRYEARAAVIKAMAHPTRLLIIEELSKNERSVGELTGMAGADTSTVSKHLAVLKNAGIVADEKQGTTVHYRLLTPCVLDFIGCIETVIESSTQRQIEVLRCCRAR